ncbi:MAG: AAA family ATPase, partial [Deinococcota bacterium]|nr:AAA family ATPase [Deinococcota bacterium]
MYLKTLGELTLEGGSFGRYTPLLLLAFLAIGGPKSRRELADLFYIDAKDPRDSLSTTLRRLQQGVPGSIKLEGRRVHAAIACDVLDLQAALNEGKLIQAVELYRGPFLQGLDGELGEELEEWVYHTRELLAVRVRQALLDIAEQAAGQGDKRTAARCAEAAYMLTCAPELEPEDSMRLYPLLKGAGSPKAAALRKEAEAYGISLFEQEAKPRVDNEQRRTRHNLPVLLTSFVGRDQELLEIADVLTRSGGRLLTLHGPGGIGKTRLALRAACQQLEGEPFLDGVFFVPLDAVTAPDFMTASIAEALGLSPKDGDALTSLKRHIAARRVLLVLDNFEHLMPASRLLPELLKACPNLTLIVTSRERLNLEAEWVLPLAGLPVPGDGVAVDDAQYADALNLFIQRAKRARLSFSLMDSDLPHALTICRLVEGYPLGLELAAAWVKLLSLAEIARELETGLYSLSTSLQDVCERHGSIRAVFEHSWKLLNVTEQAVLRKLAVFKGGFKREDAATVAGATLSILAKLVDKSLLRVLPGGRYDQHALLHQFTAAKLAEHPEEQQAVQKEHAACYFRFLEAQGKEVRGSKGKTALVALDEEFENIRVAWRQAVSDHDTEKLQKAPYLTPYLDSRARFQEGARLFEL